MTLNEVLIFSAVMIIGLVSISMILQLTVLSELNIAGINRYGREEKLSTKDQST